MIRRNQNLEILYTNGEIYWTETVKDSQVNSPYIIKDIMMSLYNKSIIAYISIPDTNTTH